MDRKTLLDLIPAYAVDALDADERQAVADFVQRDPEAQAMLADYEAISAVLPLAAPMRPAPAHLQSDLRQRLAMRKTESPAPTQVEERPAPKVLEKPEQPKQEKPSKIVPIAAWLVSAAAVFAVVIVGAFLLLRNQDTNMSPEMAAAKALFEEIAADSNAQRFDVSSAEAFSVEGELVVAADGSSAVLRIASLPQLGTEQAYQLWLASDGVVDSGGVFHWPTGHGPYYLKIDKPIDELIRIGMTIEPFDGSPSPTGTSLFAVQVAQAR